MFDVWKDLFALFMMIHFVYGVTLNLRSSDQHVHAHRPSATCGIIRSSFTGQQHLLLIPP